MNVIVNQTHRHRRQTSGSQRGEGSEEEQVGVWDLKTQTTLGKTEKQQGYVVQQRE